MGYTAGATHAFSDQAGWCTALQTGAQGIEVEREAEVEIYDIGLLRTEGDEIEVEVAAVKALTSGRWQMTSVRGLAAAPIFRV